VIVGQRPGREHLGERALTMMGGLPIQDVVAAHLAYQRAQEQDAGTRLVY
jgi:ornithine cyclodeaminase/alanine dehydrogenase-like protein (mu-crystallin family)